MKFNKWTLGLAAIGAVSLASAVTARAVEANANSVQTALNSVSISGAVDTAVHLSLYPSTDQYQSSPMGGIPLQGQGYMGQNNKQDGFNLNVVELTIQKPLDESEYASGFMVQMIMGPDAVGFNDSLNGDTSEVGFGVKQAYVALRTPVGNGIDWKIGVFNTIIGYENFESWLNPNYSRSWGWGVEPTQHEGVLASYTFSDYVSGSVGIANTLTPGIGNRNSNGTNVGDDFWCKTWMASLALTAPDSWGFFAGDSLYIGAVQGFNGTLGFDSGESSQLNFYAGTVVHTPVEGLTTGMAFDYVDYDDSMNTKAYIHGLYASYKATDKLSFHGRGELGYLDSDGAPDICWWGLTGTVQYDLWENVISRLEVRYEVADENVNPGNASDVIDSFGESGLYQHSCGAGLFLNIVYVF